MQPSIQIAKKVFRQRESAHVHDTERSRQDFTHPSLDQLSFDNYIVGLLQATNNAFGFNVLMSNGNNSKLPLTTWGESSYTEVRINPPNAKVRKIILSVNKSNL